MHRETSVLCILLGLCTASGCFRMALLEVAVKLILQVPLSSNSSD